MSDTKDRTLQELIQKLSGTHGKTFVKIFDANINSVDEASGTCIVSSIDGDKNLDNLSVRISLDISDGDLEIPEVGTTVNILMSDFTDPYIVKSTWLTNKTIIVGDTTISLKNGNIIISQGKMIITLSGGKVSIKNDTTDYLTVQKNILNHLINLIVDTGMGPALLDSSTVLNLQQDLSDLNNLMS